MTETIVIWPSPIRIFRKWNWTCGGHLDFWHLVEILKNYEFLILTIRVSFLHYFERISNKSIVDKLIFNHTKSPCLGLLINRFTTNERRPYFLYRSLKALGEFTSVLNWSPQPLYGNGWILEYILLRARPEWCCDFMYKFSWEYSDVWFIFCIKPDIPFLGINTLNLVQLLILRLSCCLFYRT